MTYNNNCGTSAVDEVITSNIRIYPNPTKGILNIEGNGEMTISVLNVLGQKVLEASATANTTIDLSGFGEGIYMVRIETENRINTEKVNVIK